MTRTRSPNISRTERSVITYMIKQGAMPTEIATTTGRSKASVYRIARELGWKFHKPGLVVPNIKHGENGYRYHRCRCDTCRKANTSRARAYWTRRQNRCPDHPTQPAGHRDDRRHRCVFCHTNNTAAEEKTNDERKQTWQNR